MDKFKTKNRKMIIKGSGKMMVKIPHCDELFTLGHMMNMRLDIQIDMQDIEGGDTAVPIDTLLRKKVIDVTGEDAKFDLNMLRLALGSKLKEGASGVPYEMRNESIAAPAPDQDGNTEINVSNNILTGGTAPKIQVLNSSSGVMLQDDAFTVSGRKITITSGVNEGDSVVVYYPVASSSIDPDGFLWVLEEKHDINGNQIQLKNQLFGGSLGNTTGKTEHVSVRLVKENKLLKKVTGNPKEGEYSIDPDSAQITFNKYLDGEQVYVNYKRPEVVDVLDLGSKDFPLTVHVVHDGHFEQKDGTVQGVQIELFQCRVKSNVTLDAARQTAATHSVTLTVLDPERSDNRLGTIKRYGMEGAVVDC